MNRLILKPGRDKSLKRHHPWVFSGAIAKIEGQPGLGDTVTVRSADGVVLAVAAYSPDSQIRARVWDWRERDIDAGFFAERVQRAAALRQSAADEGAQIVLDGRNPKVKKGYENGNFVGPTIIRGVKPHMQVSAVLSIAVLLLNAAAVLRAGDLRPCARLRRSRYF